MGKRKKQPDLVLIDQSLILAIRNGLPDFIDFLAGMIADSIVEEHLANIDGASDTHRKDLP